MLYVNKGSGCEIRARFKGYTPEGALTATIPNTVHYRLDGVKSGTAIIDWTTLTPSTMVGESGELQECYVVVEIPGSVNSIEDDKNRTEEKALLVVANKDMDQEYSEVFTYRVRRVGGR